MRPCEIDGQAGQAAVSLLAATPLPPPPIRAQRGVHPRHHC